MSKGCKAKVLCNYDTVYPRRRPGGGGMVGVLVLGKDPHYRKLVDQVLSVVTRRTHVHNTRIRTVSVRGLRMHPYAKYVTYHDQRTYILPRSGTRHALRGVR